MGIKNAKLGGADFNTPDDRVKPTDLNDTFNAAAGFLTWCGSNFNDVAQMIFNSAYLGFDARLANSGVPSLKDTFYSVFTSDDADIKELFDYDATNDLYKTADLSGVTEYIIIEADDDSIAWTNNDTAIIKISSGKWMLYGTQGADSSAVHRAKIHKSLWFGTDGTDQLILQFSNISNLKTSNANDVDKKGYFATIFCRGKGSGTSTSTMTGTFADTTTNLDCAPWSLVSSTRANGDETTAQYYLPENTLINTIKRTGSDGTAFIDDMGTDVTADELDNPADTKLLMTALGSGSNQVATGSMIVLTVSDMTWVHTNVSTSWNTETFSDIDFTNDNSIPALVAAGSLEAEDVNTSTLIFKNTVPSTDNAIAVINSQIDATSSQQISISADSGSNYTDVENVELAKLTPGTELWRKIVITRTDLSKIDKVTEQAVKHSIV